MCIGKLWGNKEISESVLYLQVSLNYSYARNLQVLLQDLKIICCRGYRLCLPRFGTIPKEDNYLRKKLKAILLDLSGIVCICEHTFQQVLGILPKSGHFIFDCFLELTVLRSVRHDHKSLLLLWTEADVMPLKSIRPYSKSLQSKICVTGYCCLQKQVSEVILVLVFLSLPHIATSKSLIPRPYGLAFKIEPSFSHKPLSAFGLIFTASLFCCSSHGSHVSLQWCDCCDSGSSKACRYNKAVSRGWCKNQADLRWWCGRCHRSRSAQCFCWCTVWHRRHPRRSPTSPPIIGGHDSPLHDSYTYALFRIWGNIVEYTWKTRFWLFNAHV